MGMDNQLRLNAYMLAPAPPLTSSPNMTRNKSLKGGGEIKGKMKEKGKKGYICQNVT